MKIKPELNIPVFEDKVRISQRCKINDLSDDHTNGEIYDERKSYTSARLYSV
jgi:hypothetical protein